MVYHAARNHLASYSWDAGEPRILSVRGFTHDVITIVVKAPGPLPSWRPWEWRVSFRQSRRFSKSITASSWDGNEHRPDEPISWPVLECRFFRQKSDKLDWNEVMMEWEWKAGGPWGPKGVNKEAFNRTVTADAWAHLPIDWRAYTVGKHPDALPEEDREYPRIREAACTHRVFFITSK